jgi:hypothetical protein
MPAETSLLGKEAFCPDAEELDLTDCSTVNPLFSKAAMEAKERHVRFPRLSAVQDGGAGPTPVLRGR